MWNESKASGGTASKSIVCGETLRTLGSTAGCQGGIKYIAVRGSLVGVAVEA